KSGIILSMENRLLHTPEGVRDIYGSDYERKLSLQLEFLQILRNYGYTEIDTPSFEYFDVYSGEIGTTPSDELYKFFDKDNNTLVLRPDFTPGVARAAAKYFIEDNVHVKLSYSGNVFANSRSLSGKLKENTELGAEYMGDSTVEADGEMIAMAVELLRSAGLKDFQICIGNAGYFKGLCEEAEIDGELEMNLRDEIGNKNQFAAANLMKGIEMLESQVDKLLRCVELFGDVSVLDKALVGISNDRSKAAIERLKAVYDQAERRGIQKYITFDLSMLSKYNYYTGIIFRAYTSSLGDAILKGGRYDNLLSKFGHDAPALGFTLSLDDLVTALSNEESGRSKDDGYLTFALTKGRLADKTIEMLEKTGICLSEIEDKDTRKLIFTDEINKVKVFLAKGPDVPTYVEYGAADIGVVGEDTILEEGRKIFEVLDLEIGKCRMCIAGPESAGELLKHHEMIRVATKYPEITKDYFQNVKHQTVDIIKLNGSIELAPIVGLSDVICDIVETGSTLKENGLIVLEEVVPLSARLVVNTVSMRIHAYRINKLIKELSDVLSER
ncbi:MAG: ATP phosphoribosyltransferase regulatory subunit, partial [Lachnospiraceae bacterium]|nr:ATP phosphoribosyltransferase regulatory subunit [Lachnospiraceae bacterium]